MRDGRCTVTVPVGERSAGEVVRVALLPLLIAAAGGPAAVAGAGRAVPIHGEDVLQHPGDLAEFEIDLLRIRTREGMAIARANGRLKGKAPKLRARQRVHVLSLTQAGEHTIAELVELFSVSRATIYREIARSRHAPT